MNVETAIQDRRSVKHFDPTHVMSEAEVEKLISLAMLAPTAFNIQHWRFVRVQDPELRAAIRAASWMQAQVTDASLFLILCADMQAWQKQPDRYWCNAPDDIREGVVQAIQRYYADREQIQRDEAMRSCALAAQTIMLAAKSMGYDSCPMDLSDFEETARLINLPDDHLIAMYIAIGKGTQEARPRGGQLALDEVMLTDRF